MKFNVDRANAVCNVFLSKNLIMSTKVALYTSLGAVGVVFRMVVIVVKDDQLPLQTVYRLSLLHKKKSSRW